LFCLEFSFDDGLYFIPEVVNESGVFEMALSWQADKDSWSKTLGAGRHGDGGGLYLVWTRPVRRTLGFGRLVVKGPRNKKAAHRCERTLGWVR